MNNTINTITLTFTGDFVTFNNKVRPELHENVEAHRFGHNTCLTYDPETELTTFEVICDDMKDANEVMKVVNKYC